MISLHPGLRSAERFRGPLWIWPTVSAAAGLAAALLLARRRTQLPGIAAQLWSADVSAAQTLLQLVATSVVTATTVTLSLTVVALQLASQQFSPRLLREFSRDAVTKRVLAVLAGTFVFASTTLLHVGSDGPIPAVAVVVSYLLALASLGAILAFITHMVKALRVDTMMLMVHDETDRAIAAFYPAYRGSTPAAARPELGTTHVRTVHASRSGFIRMIDVDRLVSAASEHGVLVSVDVRAGDHVVQGTPVAAIWSDDGSDGKSRDALADAVRDGVRFGYERTLEQDAAFGFRQLEDIAVKAMSPSINDPVTAATAVGHMADLLVSLTGRRLGRSEHSDSAGVCRVILADRDLRYFLDLACDQLRRFGSAEPTVLVALLRMLRDVAVSCHDDDQRSEVARAAETIEATASDALSDADAGAVHDLRERVESALAGDMLAAYRDRSGETRSI